MFVDNRNMKQEIKSLSKTKQVKGVAKEKINSSLSETNTLVPMVIEREGNSERSYDLFSRLLKDRVIMVTEQVAPQMASVIVGQLLFLQKEWSEATEKFDEVTMYINTPGGEVLSGMSIYDTMKMMPFDICTICAGMAASMGSVLLSGGTKGKRYILKNSEVMIHQPSGGAQGQATEIEIAARHIARTKQKLTKVLADECGKDYDFMYNKMERDCWLDAEEALDLGIVDKIL